MVLAALRARRFTLVVSQPLLDELHEVLLRPRLVCKYGIMAADVDELTTLLRSRAEMVTISGVIQMCRDPDDDAVIETAVAGQADVLVTRDDDMKSASDVVAALLEAGIAVHSVQRFIDNLADERGP